MVMLLPMFGKPSLNHEIIGVFRQAPGGLEKMILTSVIQALLKFWERTAITIATSAVAVSVSDEGRQYIQRSRFQLIADLHSSHILEICTDRENSRCKSHYLR